VVVLVGSRSLVFRLIILQLIGMFYFFWSLLSLRVTLHKSVSNQQNIKSTNSLRVHLTYYTWEVKFINDSWNAGDNNLFAGSNIKKFFPVRLAIDYC